MLNKAKVREIALKYSEKVVEAFSPAKIILFGSYVNGNPHEWSDIDIAVIVKGFQGDWWWSAAHLFKLTRDFEEIIEPHLLDSDDDPSGFVEHVIKTGEVIYQAV